jgi:glucoamylase
MPLVWAHAEFLKLLYARREKRPVELLTCVEAHMRRRQGQGTWHWCIDAPFDALPADRDLLIETSEPFRLHFGFDGWQSTEDRLSSPLPFGRHGLRLARSELGARIVLDFTFYFIDQARWHGTDYHLRLASEPACEGAAKPRTSAITEA